MKMALSTLFTKIGQSKLAQTVAIPLRPCARILARRSHSVMAIPYWAANLSLYLGNFVQNAINDNKISPSLLNPLGDFNTAAGAIAVIGGTVNLFQNKIPVLFNVAGGCVILNAGCILANGFNKPALLEHAIGTIPSIIIGLIMLTDQRYKGADAIIANDNHPPSSFKKILSDRRRLLMGAFLSVSRVSLTLSAIAKGDMTLLTYSGLKQVGDAGMMANDNKATEVLRRFGSPEKCEPKPGQ